MDSVEFRTTGFAEIDLIRPLWEQLNTYHHAHATRFRAHYEQMTFEDRRKNFHRLMKTGELRLDLAQDRKIGRYIGYCVSSLSYDGNGEIESLFVDEGNRCRGIGTALVTRALGWMDHCGAQRRRVSVGDGNETAFPFYRKFGFYPRMTVLEQVPEQD